MAPYLAAQYAARMHTDTEIPAAQCAAMTVRYYASAADVPAGAPRERRSEIQIAVTGETGDAVVILLDRDFFSSKANEALGDDAAELIERCAAADPLMRGVGSALRSEFRSQSRPSAMFLESLAGVVAIHLARNYCGGRMALRAAAGLAPGKLERVRAFIEQHLAERIRIERLAAAVHMSPFHFARLFKQATGQPPHAYLTARRVERAKELLGAGGLPLVHVAANVGFQTQGHFTEVFRRHAGVTPRHFRLMSAGRNGALTP
jgi:AraC family transcriptional regulator